MFPFKIAKKLLNTLSLSLPLSTDGDPVRLLDFLLFPLVE
jgi:hypothetical protein